MLNERVWGYLHGYQGSASNPVVQPDGDEAASGYARLLLRLGRGLNIETSEVESEFVCIKKPGGLPPGQVAEHSESGLSRRHRMTPRSGMGSTRREPAMLSRRQSNGSSSRQAV
jgi:hypothetical protein